MIPRRYRRIRSADVLDLMAVDHKWRMPVEAVSYGCPKRCYSRDNRGVAVHARFGHIIGSSYSAGEILHWRRWATAGLAEEDKR